MCVETLNNKLAPKKTISHGDSKVSRTLDTCFDSKLPADADKQVTIWIMDEWSVDHAARQLRKSLFD